MQLWPCLTLGQAVQGKKYLGTSLSEQSFFSRDVTDNIRKMLTGFPAHDLGNKFLIMTRKNIVKDFINVVSFVLETF